MLQNSFYRRNRFLHLLKLLSYGVNAMYGKKNNCNFILYVFNALAKMSK